MHSHIFIRLYVQGQALPTSSKCSINTNNNAKINFSTHNSDNERMFEADEYHKNFAQGYILLIYCHANNMHFIFLLLRLLESLIVVIYIVSRQTSMLLCAAAGSFIVLKIYKIK